jgi:hypothetical protein
MSKLARVIVALALVLVVPVQAMSAVMAGMCMAAGHHAVGHAHAADSDDTHHHDQGAPEGAPGHHHDGSDGQGSSAHCPPCGACCAAATISNAVHSFVPEPPAADAIAAAPYHAEGFEPDGLERPPLAL